jgi:hypothetical protein
LIGILKTLNSVGFEVLAEVTKKSTVFWVVTPCSPERARLLGRTYRFYLQGRRVREESKQQLSLPPGSAGFLPCLLFNPEDRGDIFIRNVGLSPNYAAVPHFNQPQIMRLEAVNSLPILGFRISSKSRYLPIIFSLGLHHLLHIMYETRGIHRKMYYRFCRDSSVGIATDCGLYGRGSIRGRRNIFFSSTVSRPALGPTSLFSTGYRGRFPGGVKWPGHETDHLPPSNAEVKNGGAIPPLPHMSSWHSA